MSKYISRKNNRLGEKERVFHEVLIIAEKFLENDSSARIISDSGFDRNLTAGEFEALKSQAENLGCKNALEDEFKAAGNIFVAAGAVRRILSGEFKSLHAPETLQLIRENMEHYENSNGAFVIRDSPISSDMFNVIFKAYLREEDIVSIVTKWRKQCASGSKYFSYFSEANNPAKRIAARYGVNTDIGFIHFADVYLREGLSIGESDYLDRLIDLSSARHSRLIKDVSNG